MTIIKGKRIVAAPCCGARYALPHYVSMNFSASEYWTDGWREHSLMPNDEGLRHCRCGRFLHISELICLETVESSDLPAMDRVPGILLPKCIAEAHSGVGVGLQLQVQLQAGQARMRKASTKKSMSVRTFGVKCLRVG